WGPQAWVLLKDYFMEWPGLFLAAGLGALTAWRVSAKWVRGLLAGWLLLGLVLVVYLNLSADRFYLLGDYALASQSLTLLFAGFALKWAVSKRGWKNETALVLVVVLAGMGLWRFLGKRQTHYTYAYDYELNLFQELPAHSLFFARGDSLVFSAWYLQWVKGLRPDLAWVGVDGLPMGWIRETLARTHHDLHVPETSQRMGLESIPPLMKWMVDKNTDRPLYLSFASIDPKIISGAPILDEGLVERVARDKNDLPLTDAQQENLWSLSRFRHWRDGEPVDGRTALFFAGDYALHRNAEGLSAEAKGDQWLAEAKGKNQARDYLKSQAAYGQALGDYLAALEWYPLEPKYAYNMGNALVELGRNQEALDDYAKAWTLNPRYAEAYFNAAVATSRLGQNQRAGDYFAKVLALQPGYPRAQENLDYLEKRGWYHP
ncbi:MAG: tetratricopeptide repeat protein, partial [bacterium]